MYFWPHDLMEKGLIDVRWIHSEDQLADFHTKGVPSVPRFERNRDEVLNAESVLVAQGMGRQSVLKPYFGKVRNYVWNLRLR